MSLCGGQGARGMKGIEKSLSPTRPHRPLGESAKARFTRTRIGRHTVWVVICRRTWQRRSYDRTLLINMHKLVGDAPVTPYSTNYAYCPPGDWHACDARLIFDTLDGSEVVGKLSTYWHIFCLSSSFSTSSISSSPSLLSLLTIPASLPYSVHPSWCQVIGASLGLVHMPCWRLFGNGKMRRPRLWIARRPSVVVFIYEAHTWVACVSNGSR